MDLFLTITFPSPGRGGTQALSSLRVWWCSRVLAKNLASSGFCKVSRALRFPGPGCRASAAQRSWRRSPVAGDLISSTGRQTPFSPPATRRRGAIAGLGGPKFLDRPSDLGNPRQVERTRVLAPRSVHRVTLEGTCGTD